MSKSRETSVSPYAALLTAQELLPPGMLAETATGFLDRSRRGTGPPFWIDKGPGTPPAGRSMYDIEVLRKWCLDQQPAPIRHAIEQAAQARLLAVLAGRAIGSVLAEIDPKDDWAEHLSAAMARLVEIRDLFEPEERER